MEATTKKSSTLRAAALAALLALAFVLVGPVRGALADEATQQGQSEVVSQEVKNIIDPKPNFGVNLMLPKIEIPANKIAAEETEAPSTNTDTQKSEVPGDPAEQESPAQDPAASEGTEGNTGEPKEGDATPEAPTIPEVTPGENEGATTPSEGETGAETPGSGDADVPTEDGETEGGTLVTPLPPKLLPGLSGPIISVDKITDGDKVPPTQIIKPSSESQSAPAANQDESEGGKPYSQIDAGDSLSADLAEFLTSMTITDKETNQEVVRKGAGGELEGELEPGREYNVYLQFNSNSKAGFRGASLSELAGISRESFEGKNAISEDEWVEGRWMFVRLDGIEASVIDGSKVSFDSDFFKISKDGKTILFDLQSARTANSNQTIQVVTMSYDGTADDGINSGEKDIVVGSTTGTYTPPTTYDLLVKKERIDKEINSEDHKLRYKVTITNVSNHTIKNVYIEDRVTSPEEFKAQGHIDGIKIEEMGANNEEHEYKIDSSNVTYDGNGFGFDYAFKQPESEAGLEPGESVVMKYWVDITELMDNVGENAKSLIVNNEALVYPEGKDSGKAPAKASEDYTLKLGSLEKTGQNDPAGYTIKWEIKLNDRYQNLAGTVVKDAIPEGLTVKSVEVYTSPDGNGEYTLVSGTSCEIDKDGNLTVTLPDGAGKYAKVVVETTYDPKETAENAKFTNTASVEHLPSELDPRSDTSEVEVGPVGFDVQKSGEMSDDWKYIDYKIDMSVSGDITRGSRELKKSKYHAGAAVLDQMKVRIGKDDEGSSIYKYVDTWIGGGIDPESIKLTATLRGGKPIEFTYTSKESGNGPYTFGVYSVAKHDSGLLVNKYDDYSDGWTAFVINPTVVDSNEYEKYKTVYGTWPEELEGQIVDIAIEYRVDPTKCPTLSDETKDLTKDGDHWCKLEAIETEGGTQRYKTLADCLGEDFSKENYSDHKIVNQARGIVNEGYKKADECAVRQDGSLSKSGDVVVDVDDSASGSRRVAEYKVTVDIGDEGDGIIPKAAGDNGNSIYFVDKFEEGMRYVDGSLRVVRNVGEDDEKTYLYEGQSPVDGDSGTIRASWGDFVAEERDETLQEDFAQHNYGCTYTFYYKLEPGDGFKGNRSSDTYVDLDNTAWVSWEIGGVKTASKPVKSQLQFPSGVLTKDAVAAANGNIGFYVEINEFGKDLLEDGDWLEVRDTPDKNENLDLRPTNVSVRAFGEEGWTDLVKVDDPAKWNSLGEGQFGVREADGSLLLKVPDGTRLLVYYEYSLKDGKTPTVTVSNAVEVIGTSIEKYTGSWSFDTASIMGGYGGSNTSFKISKVREADPSGGEEVPVGGAKFYLYVPNTLGQGQHFTETVGTIPNINDKNEVLWPAWSYTTNEDGSVAIDWSELTFNTEYINNVYALKEYDAPAGYQLIKAPIYFTIDKGDDGNAVVSVLNESAFGPEGGDEVTIKDGSRDLTIGNIYESGDLTVAKAVEGNTEQKSADYKFTVTLSDSSINGKYGDMEFKDGKAEFTLKDAESRNAKGLPAGVTYIVNEEDVADCTTTSENESGAIELGKTVTSAFTNTFDQTTELTVAKAWKNADGTATPPEGASATLQLTRDGEDVPGQSAELSAAKGWEHTFENLPKTDADGKAFTYSVRESASSPKGFTATGPADVDGKLTVTNEFVGSGELTVSKNVTGKDGNKETQFTFTVELDDETYSGTYGDMEFKNGIATFKLKDNETKTATGLTAGITYKVTEAEANSDGYATTYTGETGSITANSVKTAEFTNTKGELVGSLAVAKTVAGDGADTNRQFAFDVQLLLDSEQFGNSVSYPMTVKGNGQPSTAQVAFNLGEDGKYHFTVNLSHGQTVTFDNIPVGARYMVLETDYSREGYTSTTNGNFGAIENEKTSTVAFTNNYKPVGGLSVTKTVTGAGDQLRQFNFTVTLSDTSVNGTYGDMEFVNGVATFTLSHGQTKTASGLFNGIDYTVTEAEANQDGYATTFTDETGQIPADATAQAEFTNYLPEPGSLAVTKNVTGAGDRNAEFHFHVQLSDPAINGRYGEMDFANGVSDFTLRHGQTLTATGLPAGITHEVTEVEANQGGYTTTHDTNAPDGLISSDRVATHTFTNYYPTGTTTVIPGPTPRYGSLTIVKSIEGPAGEAASKTFTFTVSGPNGFSQQVSITGVGAATLTNLAPGEYTIEEDDASIEGFEWSVMGDDLVEVAANDVTMAEFTNYYDTTPLGGKGSLTIVKAIAGGGEAAASKTYTFTVTGPDGQSQKVSVTGEGAQTIEGLDVGEYTVTEDGAEIEGWVWKGTVSKDGKATVVPDNDVVVVATNVYEPETPTEPTEPTEPTDPTPTEPTIPTDQPGDTLTDIPEGDVPLANVPTSPIPHATVPVTSSVITRRTTNNNTSTSRTTTSESVEPTAQSVPSGPAATTSAPDDTVEIIDDSVPLAYLPKTGDQTSMAAMAAIAIFGALGIAFGAKMLKDEDEK